MEITAKEVAALRSKTGVGMMDCKNALKEANGDMEKAIVILREKGIATAIKRADKTACEGRVDSYIHLNGKIGVLVEVNCETDFVANSDQFKALAHDIALQISAAKPIYVAKSDVPEAELAKEREILRIQAMNEGKPEKIAEKIVEGRLNKYYKEVCLLEQDFIKDPDMTVNRLITDAIGKIGEKISVRRFARYEMGEGLEKKTENFAAEIDAEVRKVKESVGK